MIKNILRKYFTENKYDICMICTFLVIGCVAGICIYFAIDTNTITELKQGIEKVLEDGASGNISKSSIIANEIRINLILFGILMFLSITLIGRWGIYCITTLKGMAIGIYTCLLFSIFNIWWGILVVFLLVVLVNIVYIPAYIYLLTTLLAFNFELFSAKKSSSKILLNVICKTSASLILMFSSGILEQIFSNILFKIYGQMLL